MNFNRSESGLYLPSPPPKTVDEIAREQRQAYYDAHRRCPRCGSNQIERTTVGYIVPPDENRATCGCGWTGIVHDLVEDAQDSPEDSE